MCHSGMRISEIINLKVQDVDFTSGWQYGKTKLKKRKRKGESYVNIDREFVPELKKYKDTLKLKGTDYWFTSKRKDDKGNPLPYTQGSSINNSIRSYLR